MSSGAVPILLQNSNNIVCYNLSMAPEQIRPADTSHNRPRIIRTEGLRPALSRWQALWDWILAPTPEAPGAAARVDGDGEQGEGAGAPIDETGDEDNV